MFDDELVIDAKDDYNSLPYKTKEGHRWARENGYDFIFQAFTDTYCVTSRMLTSGFEKYDYVGHFWREVPLLGKEMNPGCYASGGAGYWLSPRATDLLIQEEPDIWAEDMWVGRVMTKHNILGTQDPRYLVRSNKSPDPDVLTLHLSMGTDVYDPAWMYDAHRSVNVK
jgi:hypothetical protein